MTDTTIHSGGELKIIPVDAITSKEQVRVNFEGIDVLAASIKACGLIQPVIVSDVNSDGFYVIQEGERRWRACKKLKLPQIEAIVRKTGDTRQTIIHQLVENIQRNDLKPMEICKALSDLYGLGVSQVEIARRIGRSTTFVSRHLGLAELPLCVQALCDAGKCSDTESMVNLKKSYLLDAAQCEAYCEIAMNREDGSIQQETRDLLKSLQQKNKPAGKTTKTKGSSSGDHEIRRLEEGLSSWSGYPVGIKHNGNGSGVLQLKYADLDELDGILEKIGYSEI